MIEYKIEVKSWMRNPSTPDFDFMQRFNHDIPMPLVIMYTGGKVDETARMVKLSLHGDIKQRVTMQCMCCRRPITNKISQFFGLGPICGEHNYVNPFDTEEELNAAVASYRERLVNTKWIGWIPVSAILSINDISDPTEIRKIIADMPIEIIEDELPEITENELEVPEPTVKQTPKFVISARIDTPVKCTDDFSVFLSFPYNKDVVATVKELHTRFWNPDNKEWEIPYSCLAGLRETLADFDFDIQGEDKIPAPISVENLDYSYKTEPMAHQSYGVFYGLNHSRWLLGDDQGLGKALALNTKIYTPNGYKLMKDIEVGDYVFGKDGKPTKVIATYNHHNVEMYRITFSDGVTIDCCKDHLWKIHDQHGTKVVDTMWFLSKDQFGHIRRDNLFSCGAYKYWIDRCDPVMFERQDISVDPYVLGALLGDGGLSGNTINFTSTDAEIVSYINSRLPEGYILNSSDGMNNFNYNIVSLSNKFSIHTPNMVKHQLRQLGLMGTTSHTKFIPTNYKYNTIDVRKAVLCGLLDTDGYASSDNLVQYTTVSKQLCDDVAFLVESLGGIASISSKFCSYNDKVTGIAYTLTIRFDHPHELFMLSRKRNLLSSRKFQPRRNIVKIEPISNADAKCITVDNEDHLYLADHFVVTHNTKQIIDLAMIRKQTFGFKHCLIVCGVNGLKWNWIEEIQKHSDESGWILGQLTRKRTGKVYIGSTKDKIADLDKLLNGEGDYPYFLITNIESLRNTEIADKLKELCDKKIIQMVAVDELHRCKNLNTQQGAGMMKVQPYYRVGMTGTPLMNTPLDLFAIMKWLGYEPYEFGQFKYHFCDVDEWGNVVGYKNIDQLRGQLSSFMLRRTKEEVLDLPAKVYSTEYVDMTPEQVTLYNRVIDGTVRDPDIPNNDSECILATLLKLRQISGGIGKYSNIVKNPKLDRLEQIVEEAVYSGTKVIVYSNWIQGITPAVERLAKYNPIVITGETKDADRQSIVNRFQNDDSVKVILGTIGALGTGLTLTAATEVVFIDEPWTNAAKEQACDRAHRIGTTSMVHIHTIISHGTYDEDVHDIVLGKRDLATTIVEKRDLLKLKIA